MTEVASATQDDTPPFVPLIKSSLAWAFPTGRGKTIPFFDEADVLPAPVMMTDMSPGKAFGFLEGLEFVGATTAPQDSEGTE